MWTLTLPTGPLSGGLSFTIPLSRTDAPRVKPHLRVLFAGYAVPTQHPLLAVEGATWNGYSLAEAIIDDPLEVATRFFNLNFDIQDVWVFDEVTGKVYARWSEQPKRNEMKLAVYNGTERYAHASISGNNALTLMRISQASAISVSEIFELVATEKGVLTSGTTVGYGEMRVQVSNASGERLSMRQRSRKVLR